MFFKKRSYFSPKEVDVFQRRSITDQIYKLHKIEFVHEISRNQATYIYQGVIRSTENDHSDKYVIVKLLITNNKIIQEKFETEAALYTRFHHENLIRIEFTKRVDFGRPLGMRRYIVMEYIDGVTCKDLITYLAVSGTRLPVRIANEIIIKVLKALDSVFHLKNDQKEFLKIIHADISPNNILISKQGQVKLIDFGIAVTSSEKKKDGNDIIAGKFAYMSPEQALGQPLDQRSDLFSLSLVFAELLLAIRLNPHTDFKAALDCTINARYPFLDKADVDSDFLRVIKKNLSQDKHDRLTSAAEMIDILEDLSAKKKTYVKTRELTDLISTVVSFHNQQTQIQEKNELQTAIELPVSELPTAQNYKIKAAEFWSKLARSKESIKFSLSAGLGILMAVGVGYFLLGQSRPLRAAIDENPQPKIISHALVSAEVPPVSEPKETIQKTEVSQVPLATPWQVQINLVSDKAQLTLSSGKQKWTGSGNLKLYNLDMPAATKSKSFLLKVSRSGFKSQEYRFTLTPADSNYRKTINLEKAEFGNLYVGATPWAQVSIPGYASNKEIPFDLKLPEGNHTLIAKYQDDEDKWHKLTKQITIKANAGLKCLVFFSGNDRVECN